MYGGAVGDFAPCIHVGSVVYLTDLGSVCLDLVSKAQCNIAYFPANGDVDCEPFIATLQGKGFSHSYTKRYEDQIHGFCAARGDWNKPDVMAAAEEVIAASIAFFNQCLEAK
jgi:protein XRP2